MSHPIKTIVKRTAALVTTFMAIFMLGFMADAAMAQGKSDHARGKNKNIGHNNASDGIMGRIKTNRSIVYIGDPLEISVRFPRGAQLITSGEVDAWLLIFSPIAKTIKVPVSSVASERHRKLFEIGEVDISELPEGVYQLGLVITVPGGDPLNIEDWYNGMLGLITVRGVTVSGMPLELDLDHDGELDDDLDGDGFKNDEEEEEFEKEEEEEFDDDSDEACTDEEGNTVECIEDEEEDSDICTDAEGNVVECIEDEEEEEDDVCTDEDGVVIDCAVPETPADDGTTAAE